MSFSYLLHRILAAPFEQTPFRHLWIDGLFSEAHFSEIIRSPEVAIPTAHSDEHLFDLLFEAGYRIIAFPGCITDRDEYIDWRRRRGPTQGRNNSACEGFGITLRLASARTPIISELMEFMSGDAFQNALAAKFSIARDEVFYDSGIQKYLDGYEISPHPDIRLKALTYMVNVNPAPRSDAQLHHTHYLRLRDGFRHVQAYWDDHPAQDRCWLPWDWCETEKVQRANNSMVVFAPDNRSIHGVKAQYDHLPGQRTQLYGNLWRRHVTIEGSTQWEQFQPMAPG